jgi:GMP synthase (glutamine-hydrolysing)
MNSPLRILILDNNREENSFGGRDLVRWSLKTAPIGTEVMVRRSPERDFPVDLHYDALLLSGSLTSCLEIDEPWVKPYDDYVTAQIHMGKPILGICYGHQTIARCLFRMNKIEPKLGCGKDAEFGWQKIKINGPSEIFAGLPNEFYTYESHYEEVSELPPGTKSLAESDRCKIQAFEIVGKPIYAVQFHPEYSMGDAEQSMAKKIKKGVRKDWIYNENVGNSIFGNFFKIASQYRSS